MISSQWPLTLGSREVYYISRAFLLYEVSSLFGRFGSYHFVRSGEMTELKIRSVQ